MSTRVLIPSGVLGLGFDEEALWRGVDAGPDLIAIDGGSTDSGPASLGTGTSKYSRSAIKAEWRVLMKARAQAGVPLVVGTCGTAGADAHVDWMYEITREQSEQRLTQQAHSDPLTQLPNRAHLQTRFDLERSRHQRQGNPLSLVLLDLDFFKRINDTHGHAAGDKALQYFANLMRTTVRQTDLVARMGGEEFCLLLPDTDKEQARMVADKIRRKLSQEALDLEGAPVTLTVSGGIAQLGADGDTLDILTRSADEKLYEAKSTGRNRIAA